MPHMATSLAMGGWAGFFGVWSARLLDTADLLPRPDRIAPAIAAFFHDTNAAWPVPVLPAHETIAFAAVFGALAIGAAASLAALAGTPSGRRSPEVTVAAVLCAAVAFYLSALVTGSPLAACFGSGPIFLLCVAASFAVLLFERMMAVDDDHVGAADFEAALRSLHEADMRATQARWHENRGHERDPRR